MVCALALLGVLAVADGSTPSVEPAVAAQSDLRIRVAVLPIESSGDLAAAAVQGFEDRIVLGMVRSGLEFVPPTQVRQTQGYGPHCDDACVRALGQASNATHVLRTSITAKDEMYRFTIQALASNRAQVLFEVEGSCEICGQAEALELVQDRIGRVAERLVHEQDLPPMLEVRTEPTGATVTVDGETLGPSPGKWKIAPGPHVVEATKHGYSGKQQRIVAIAGVDETIELSLNPVRPGSVMADAASVRSPMAKAGIAMLVLGAVGVGAGAPLMAIDGRNYKADCAPDINGNCEHVYNTMVAGGVLLGVGVAVVTTGAVLFVKGRRPRGRSAAQHRLPQWTGQAWKF